MSSYDCTSYLYQRTRNLTGKRFGYLVVIAFAGYEDDGIHHVARWVCQCDCGVTTKKMAHLLLSGTTKSCGCYGKSHLGKLVTTHGHARHSKSTKRSAEYIIWTGIVQRCTNPNHTTYHNYGGRGITICKRWRSFEKFLEDVGPRPSKKHTIDRIDNSGPYSPDNYRWATPTQQHRNRRDNRFITHQGETLCVQAWIERSCISKGLFYARLRAGWSMERILTQPAHHYIKKNSI